LQWVFLHYPGLYDPRLRAGEKLRQSDEDLFWMLMEQLFHAQQANDRLFGLEVLDELLNDQHENSPQVRAMLPAALHLLQTDSDFLVRITAGYRLQKCYPDEVREVAHYLLSSGDERGGRNIRGSAAKLLVAMNRK
jgi:hypothetical protein